MTFAHEHEPRVGAAMALAMGVAIALSTAISPRASAASSPPSVVSLPLEADTLSAVELGPDGALRLAGDVYQAGKDPAVLSLEAEQLADAGGTAITAESVQDDKAASGGRYVANPKTLSARFELAAKGSYALALRVRHPASLFLQYGFDAPGSYKWKSTQGQAKWNWTPLRTVTLDAGIHQLYFDLQNTEKTGYARMDIDKIVIYPRSHRFTDEDLDLDDTLSDTEEGLKDGAVADLPGSPVSLPRGKGPTESLRGFATGGTVTFAALDLVDGFTFLRLQAEVESAGGAVAWRFRESPDGEWRSAPLDAEVAGAPTNRLYIGATVARGAPADTPVIKTVRCTLRADPERLLTLENRYGRLLFSKADGSLLGIWQCTPGRWLTVYPQRRPLYRLSILDAKAKDMRALDTPWTLEHAACSAGRAEFQLSTAEGKIGLTGTLTMDDTPLLRWAIRVRNDSAMDIRLVDIALPYLAFSAPDGDAQLIMPSGLWGRGLGSSMTFPGSAALGWMDYSDRQGGLSIAARDPEWNMVKLGAPKTGDRPFAGFTAGQWYPIGAGSNHTFELALGIHPGDWHWTADRYREWIDPLLQRPSHPAWLANSHGWCNLSGESRFFFRKSSDFLPDAEWLGLPFGQYWGNNADEVYCGIYPGFNPRLGKPEEMRRDAAILRRKGGHAGYYVCCFRWHPDFAEGDRLGLNYKKFLPPDLRIESKEWAVANAAKWASGQPLRSMAVECYETETATAMCLASEGWQEHQRYWAGEWAKTFSVDSMYFDGAGIHDNLCFDESHKHGKNPGLAPRGMAETIKQANAVGRQANPDFVTAMEGMSAVVGQHCNINLSSSSPSADFGKEYLYTFPDRLVYRGDGNGCFQWTGLSRRDFLMSVYVFHRFDLGVRLDDYLYLKDILMLRDRVRDWMYGGRFMDDVGLSVPAAAPGSRAGRAKWFRYDRDGDKGSLINFDNPAEGAAREPLSLDTEQAGQPTVGVLYALGGECQVFTPKVEGGRVALPVITNRLASVLLVSSVAPERSLRMHAVQQLAKGEDGIRVWLCNLSPLPRTLAVTVAGATNLTLRPASVELALAAGSVTNLFLAIPDIQQLSERVWLTVTAGEGGKPAGSTQLLVAPPLHNRGFEVDDNSDGTPDDWFNRNSRLFDEIVRFCHSVDPRSLIFRYDESVTCEGRRSLRLDGVVPYTVVNERDPDRKYLEPNPWGQGDRTWVKEATQLAILKPDTAYAFACRVRRQGPSTPYGISLSEDGAPPAGNKTLLDLQNQPSDPCGEWFQVSGEFTTGPGNAVHMLSFRGGRPDAPVWFDQMALVEKR